MTLPFKSAPFTSGACKSGPCKSGTVAGARNVIVGMAVALSVALAGWAPAPARGATPQQVEDALKKSMKYLRDTQKPNGSWDEDVPAEGHAGLQWGGWTAIATYALLAGGDSHQDEHIQKAVRWLGRAKVTGTYAVGLRAQVWTYLPMSKDVRAAIKRDADQLLKIADGNGRWGYSTMAKGG